jgi:predicted short-subunit dehydrogenase-like oxidoreductase (DUF2520 family)
MQHPAIAPTHAAAPPCRIGFIGAGRLATALAWALARRGAQVVAVSSAGGRSAQRLAEPITGCQALASAQQVVDASDLVLVAVPDDAIAPTVAQLRWRTGRAVVHCSAATEVEALRAAAEQGADIGGFHPLQAFGDPEAAIHSLPGCTIAIEAEGPLRTTLEALAALLECPTIRLPPGSRPRYHAAAHYAAGFVFAMLNEAAEIWKTFGVPRDDTVAALLPLLRGTTAAMASSGVVNGLPGIFSRGDIGTLGKHLDALSALGDDRVALYRLLALRSLPLGLERGGLSESAAATMRGMLEASGIRDQSEHPAEKA